MKTKQELALHKLERAKKLFSTLQTKLEYREKINKKSVLWTLALCAKNYSSNTEDLQYKACVRMYNIFGITKTKYPDLAEKLKIMLRRISYKFYSKPRPQLNFIFG